MILVTIFQLFLVIFIVTYLFTNMVYLIRLYPVNEELVGYPYISVCIPARNEERDIKNCVESLLSQDYPNFEVIVVDDGSVDASASLIANIDRDIVFLSQDNAGAAAARNLGAKNAKGKFLAFLDADDVWSRFMLEIQVRALESHSDARFSFTGSILTNEAGLKEVFASNESQVSRSCIVREVGFDEVFVNPCLGTPNVMIERLLFESLGGFDDSLVTFVCVSSCFPKALST